MRVQAFYLPLVFLAISLCMGGDWLGELMGVLVGHLCAPGTPAFGCTGIAALQQKGQQIAPLMRASHAGALPALAALSMKSKHWSFCHGFGAASGTDGRCCTPTPTYNELVGGNMAGRALELSAVCVWGMGSGTTS